MKATDKQISYLTSLQNKYNKMIDASKDILQNVEKFNIDWHQQRDLGMTTVDASMKIDAFKTLIRNTNFARHLCNRKQF